MPSAIICAMYAVAIMFAFVGPGAAVSGAACDCRGLFCALRPLLKSERRGHCIETSAAACAPRPLH